MVIVHIIDIGKGKGIIYHSSQDSCECRLVSYSISQSSQVLYTEPEDFPAPSADEAAASAKTAETTADLYYPPPAS